MIDWFKKIYKNIQESNDKQYLKQIVDLKNDKKALTITLVFRENIITALRKDCELQLSISNQKQEELLKLQHKLQLLQQDKTSELETYWNNKIKPTTKLLYNAREKGVKINVLGFFNKENDLVPIIIGKSNDEKALKCLLYVKRKIRYTQKKDKEKNGEFWQFANETLYWLTGDCEDGAILMANMMVAAGIPYWRIRINAGDVTWKNRTTGHAYVTYLREKDNKWIVLDWCYYYKSKGTLWTNAKKYFGIWFSFNQKYCFKKAELDRNETKN